MRLAIWLAAGVYAYGVVSLVGVNNTRLDRGDALLVAAAWPAILVSESLSAHLERKYREPGP